MSRYNVKPGLTQAAADNPMLLAYNAITKLALSIPAPVPMPTLEYFDRLQGMIRLSAEMAGFDLM